MICLCFAEMNSTATEAASNFFLPLLKAPASIIFTLLSFCSRILSADRIPFVVLNPFFARALQFL